MKTIDLKNGPLSFKAYTLGSGPLVLCLHGFPDSAITFRNQIKAVSDAGYCVVAPMMRGYEPSSQPADGDYSIETIANDVIAWMDQLGEDKAHLVGHDWGASVAFVAGALAPHRFYSITAIAVPHAARFGSIGVWKVPTQLLKSWYMNFFQLRGIAEFAVRRNNWALLKKLWNDWSPGHQIPDRYWNDLIETFSAPGVLEAMLNYYRTNATPLKLLGIVKTAMTASAPIQVPILAITGAQDGCIDTRIFDHVMLKEDFPQGLRLERIQNVGHFAHLEAPDILNPMIIAWLTEHETIAN